MHVVARGEGGAYALLRSTTLNPGPPLKKLSYFDVRVTAATMQEVEFLRGILKLDSQSNLLAVLQSALEILLTRTAARYGYIEVQPEHGRKSPPWWTARAASDDHLELIKTRISRGVIAHARVTGRSIITDAAHADPRFQGLESVREHELGPLLCAPFDNFWASGVVYLQGRIRGSTFSREDQEAAEVAADQLALISEVRHSDLRPPLSVEEELSIIERQRVEEALRRTEWNISAVHRETGLSRDYIRRLLRRGTNGDGHD